MHQAPGCPGNGWHRSWPGRGAKALSGSSVAMRWLQGGHSCSPQPMPHASAVTFSHPASRLRPESLAPTAASAHRPPPQHSTSALLAKCSHSAHACRTKLGPRGACRGTWQLQELPCGAPTAACLATAVDAGPPSLPLSPAPIQVPPLALLRLWCENAPTPLGFSVQHSLIGSAL